MKERFERTYACLLCDAALTTAPFEFASKTHRVIWLDKLCTRAKASSLQMPSDLHGSSHFAFNLQYSTYYASTDREKHVSIIEKRYSWWQISREVTKSGISIQ